MNFWSILSYLCVFIALIKASPLPGGGGGGGGGAGPRGCNCEPRFSGGGGGGGGAGSGNGLGGLGGDNAPDCVRPLWMPPCA